jgi:serine/threonine protein phosphatase 1
LKLAGFNPNKYSHKIVLCGDLFDRMSESQQVYKFTKEMLEKDKLIYIKGNHEQLLLDCCRRGYPGSHDISNGTARTVWDLGYGVDFDEMCKHALVKVRPLIDKAVNYFETKNHIFVHSWIPMVNKDGLPAYYTKNRVFEFNPDWRNASQKEWDEATWGNPFKMAEQGLLPDKTIVFGHWHCSTGWAKAENRSEFGDDAKFDPYYGDGFIGIDACTAHSGKCNVIVIEDDFLEDEQ